MSTIWTWLATQSVGGASRGVWGLVGLLVTAEMILGRSSDPRWRSLADSIRNLLGLIIGSIPMVGAPAVRALRALYVVPKPAGLETEIEKSLKSGDGEKR